MKIKFELELDTNDDTDIGHELMDLVSLFKARLEEFNEEAEDDEEEYEEEVVAENPKPKKRFYRRRRNN
ncbi:hypothetical protein N9O93_01745 [bacterium]|nr:hypothetical protein [Hellea sp.]MDA9047717.1 hypothetical protein [Hellea sp.]MDA9225397.1 hypothetical protein [bacterium]